MKILIAGDYCPLNRVAEKLDNNDFDYVLGEIKQITSKSDYSIVNLECPITKRGELPIEKIGPNLQCSETGVEALKWAGFDCVTLANNHFLDFGPEGVEHTLQTCKKYGVDTVGGGLNIEKASNVLYKDIQGTTIAIINCCEHEFSIASEERAGSNPLNPINQYYSIKEARQNADYVLVIVHGGNEHYALPSPRMKETYRFFVDAGADTVINHHQHCYSGYEVYKNKPIFYGLGNFCFDMPSEKWLTWHEGFMVEIDFAENISFNLIPYIACREDAKVIPMRTTDLEKFTIEVNRLNKIIEDNNELGCRYQSYLDTFRNDCDIMFQPYSRWSLRKLYQLHLLPSLISNRKRFLLLAYLQCESHFPKFMNYLKS